MHAPVKTVRDAELTLIKNLEKGQGLAAAPPLDPQEFSRGPRLRRDALPGAAGRVRGGRPDCLGSRDGPCGRRQGARVAGGA